QSAPLLPESRFTMIFCVFSDGVLYLVDSILEAGTGSAALVLTAWVEHPATSKLEVIKAINAHLFIILHHIETCLQTITILSICNKVTLFRLSKLRK
ncbi:hypothetical protein ACOIDY_29605, partial [Klebsiella pneumoniae]